MKANMSATYWNFRARIEGAAEAMLSLSDFRRTRYALLISTFLAWEKVGPEARPRRRVFFLLFGRYLLRRLPR